MSDARSTEDTISDDDGYAIAERLGEEAFAPMGGGLDGKVFALESGLVLKVTRSAAEAALCKVMMDARETDELPEALFRVTDVRSFVLSDGRKGWAIVREELRCVFEDACPVDDRDVMDFWEQTAFKVRLAWHMGYASLREAACSTPPPGLSVRDVFVGLDWLYERTGGKVGDLGKDNFGVNPRGRLCVRDLGNVEIKPAALSALLSRIEPAPDSDRAPLGPR